MSLVEIVTLASGIFRNGSLVRIGSGPCLIFGESLCLGLGHVPDQLLSFRCHSVPSGCVAVEGVVIFQPLWFSGNALQTDSFHLWT